VTADVAHRPVPPDAVAVIGAGLAGLTAARVLHDRGRAVTVFDKGRGVGGRLSTRRADVGPFDHGAQYFTARDPLFRRAIEGWIAAGAAAPWAARIVRMAGGSVEVSAAERFVGTPGMSAIPRHLARDLPDVRTAVRIDAIGGGPGAWTLRAEDGTVSGPFATVLVAVPSVQARPLVDPIAPALALSIASATMAPCWAVMVAFGSPVARDAAAGPFVATPFDAAIVADGPLSWAVREGSKPGRPPGERWVLHGSADWSAAMIEEPADVVIRELLAAFAIIAGPLPAATFTAAHRWRYALATRSLDDGFVFDAGLGIGIAGDWCAGARVEAAFLSGHRLAAAVAGDGGAGFGH
jgi:renalase